MLLKSQVRRKHVVANNIELPDLLLYQNKTVITYFCYHRPELTVQEVNELFTDLLSWMWLNNQRAKLGKKTYLFGPLLLLDELWHAFILHTRDYVDFSIHYFGAYFHHDIEPIGFEHVMEEDELADYLQDCFTYLGVEWVSRRFEMALVETS
ncbi:hypothetical protein [Legionella sainthelensi]|uniref:hypothetical protein n=1 Tax=Legionella sainthelensi TaxID=28087 RepID=UPI00157FA853|nr:hypothetical protein [Legionella sainthelensi]